MSVKNRTRHPNMIIIINVLLFVSLVNVIEARRGDIEIDYWDVCSTDECIEFGNFLQNIMDKTVNPCDDFYSYACGGWRENHQPREPAQSNSVSREYIQKVNRRLIDILQTPIQNTDYNALINAKNVYAMCTGNLSDDGLNHLMNLIGRVGEWPILSQGWNIDGNVRWQNISSLIDTYYIDNPFYGLELMPQIKTRSRKILLKPPAVSGMDHVALDRQINRDENAIRQLVRRLNVFHALGLQDDSVERDIRSILSFTRQLATLAPANTISISTNIEGLQDIYVWNDSFANLNVHIDWLAIIQNVYNMHNIDSDEEIVVRCHDYFLKLSALLNRTPLRTIVNYMIWSFIRPLMKHTNELMRRTQNFPNTVERRELQCLFEPNLEHVKNHEYIKLYSSNNTRTDVTNYINRVNAQLIRETAESRWLDDKTKSVIRDKMEHIRMQVVGPEWYSDDAVNDYYGQVQVSESYFDSIVNIIQFNGRAEAKLLREPLNITDTDNYEWNIFNPLVVNAAYDANTNTMCFPAAPLTGLFYHHALPASINFGLLGSIAGHELSHALDPQGRLYDRYGEYNRSWSDNANNIYNGKARCFQRQYNNYTIPGTDRHLDGSKTLNENVADTGIQAAYRAFQSYIRDNPRSKIRLSNMENYPDEKMFFLSSAVIHCESFRPGVQGIEDVHSPGWARVRGSLSNMPEFAAVFHCPAGSQMNPVDKCSLWD